MGKMNRYVCRNCGFEAELGSRQPYYIMSGSITEKYCPQTGEIVEIFREYDAGPPEISCLEEAREETPCQNCKGECLLDLEILALDNEALDSEAVEAYKCPRCGDELQCDHMTMILVD